jgi:hypothetical protein
MLFLYALKLTWTVSYTIESGSNIRKQEHNATGYAGEF